MKSLETLFTKLNTIRLSESSKTRIREELSAYADLHTVSDVSVTIKNARRFPFAFFSSRVWAALAILVLIIGVTGGTAYASTSALPGDALYGIKVNVTEPVQTALIPSPRGKAAWHAILAERRLEEATQLAAKNDLTQSDQQELAANFSTQVNESVSAADNLQKMGDVTSSLDVRSDLEARLTAHERILGMILAHMDAEHGSDMAMASTTEASTTTTTTDSDTANASAQTFLALVRAREVAVQSARVALENQIAAMPSMQSGTTTSATTTATVAVFSHGAMPFHGFRQNRQAYMTAHIEHADQARSQEIQHILSKNAGILAAFGNPPLTASTTASTTTASTTATTTATTTESGTSSTEASSTAHDPTVQK